MSQPSPASTRIEMRTYSQYADPARRWTHALLRIVAGFLFFQHGAPKLLGTLPGSTLPPEAPAALMSLMGISGVLETVGGALLMLGWMTRPVAFVLAGEMAVAYFYAHAPDGFWPGENRGELAALYAFVFLWLAAHGAGIWSVDAWRHARRAVAPLAAAILLAFTHGDATALQGPAPAPPDTLFPAWHGTATPGCDMAAVRNGRVTFRRSYGAANLADGIPIRPGTVFGIASMTKQFTAALVGTLVRSGAVRTSDDIRQYFPELPDFGTPITVADLLHHTSGLRDYLTLLGLAGRDAEGALTSAEAIALLARQRAPNFAPGTAHLYSNSNYFLLGMLVERVTRQPLPQVATQRLFDPLGMKHTLFLAWSGRIVPGLATSYREEGNDTLLAVPLRGELRGDGGLYSTVDDLLRWEAFLSGRLVPSSLEGIPAFLHERGALRDGTSLSYAGGLAHDSYRGLPTVAHGGTWGGYRAFMVRFPTKALSAIVLCNQLELRPTRVAFDLADHFLAADLSPAPAPASSASRDTPGPGAPSPADLAGAYSSPELEAVHRVTRTGTRWQVQIADADPDSTTRASGDTLWVGQWRYSFIRGANGAVRGFRLDGNRVRGILFERVPEQLFIRRGRPVQVDGSASPGEWLDADSVTINAAGGPVVVRFKHDGTHLLFAFNGLTLDPVRVPEVLLDVNGNGGTGWGADDLWLHVSFQDCWGRGRYGDYSGCRHSGTGIEANNFQDGAPAPTIVELAIPLATTGLAPGTPFGIAFVVTDTRAAWELWPAGADHLVPASWGRAVLQP